MPFLCKTSLTLRQCALFVSQIAKSDNKFDRSFLSVNFANILLTARALYTRFQVFASTQGDYVKNDVSEVSLSAL